VGTNVNRIFELMLAQIEKPNGEDGDKKGAAAAANNDCRIL
jgi:hypothetical protein